MKDYFENKKNCMNENRVFLRLTSKSEIVAGWLALVDKSCLNNFLLIEKLTKWRNNFKKYFLTQFNATPERTKKWLEDVVIPSKQQLFFEVLDAEKNSIGNAGIRVINSSVIELDNFLRGESGGFSNLMRLVELKLLELSFIDLNADVVVLQVFSNNWIAINNHLEFGFEKKSTKKLSIIHKNDEIVHHVDSNIGIQVRYSYLQLSLEKLNFLQNYSSLKEKILNTGVI